VLGELAGPALGGPAQESFLSISPTEALARCIDHREIFHDEMLSLWRRLMSGELSPVQIAGVLVGLRVKKETIGEIAAAARIMREFATKVEVPDRIGLVDTGGTSEEALGAQIVLPPQKVAECLEETGIGFMFAPNHHAAMKHAAPVRKELGVRTIFNILGPLTNPASAPNQLMGVFHPDLVGIQVRVLQQLGSEHVLVVYGKDGMHEESPGAATAVRELQCSNRTHPSGGLRHEDGVQPGHEGRQRQRIQGDGSRSAGRHAGHAARDCHAERRRGPVRGRLHGFDRGGHRPCPRGDRQRRGAQEARPVRLHHAQARCAMRPDAARRRLAAGW
jgi:hypothetical protein